MQSNIENSAGLGVNNHYGARNLQDGLLSGGRVPTKGTEQEMVIYVKGSDFVSGSFDPNFLLPAGSLVLSATAEVTEAFVLGGTTPTINVGTNGSEGTNFAIELSEAQAEAVGVYDDAAEGTWAARLAADTTVGVALGGTSPTVTDAGAAKIVVRYSKI